MEKSKYITKHLDRLLLDPNNYRFIDHRDYKLVPPEQMADHQIQLRTMNLLVGRNNENIKDLMGSFKANGILKLDPIQVREVPENKFLVVEGNRRTAALKFLYEDLKRGNDVGQLTQESFRSIDLVQMLEESPVQHLVTMGLHHISGKRKWSPVNQAQLIQDLIYKHKQEEEEVMEELGITKHSLRRSLRTLALIDTYKASDYGDQFDPTQYSIFEEIIKTPKIKSWIGWDDNEREATKRHNLDRLFSWISEEEVSPEDESLGADLIRKDPIITKSHEIRELSDFINDEAAIAKMEESRSLTTGYALSDAIAGQKFKNAIENLTKDVHLAFQFNEYMEEDDLAKIAVLRDKIDKLMPSSRALLEVKDTFGLEPLHAENKRHFENIYIDSYCKLNELTFAKLSRVNIIAGGNNVGKTSLLECIYLITQLNNLSAFVEQQRYRGKFYKTFRTYWLSKTLDRQVHANATFNGEAVELTISRVDDDIDSDKSQYLSSIHAVAKTRGQSLSSVMHLFSNKDPEEFYERRRMLCRAAFSSPFRHNEEQLAIAYDQTLAEKSVGDIVAFIREKMDSTIQEIDISSDKRFLVTSSKFENAMDITRFGEGMQRVFEIALLMVRARNGIVCIDEFDAAIHKSLLIDFTRFVEEAAERFNVQVFLSTHSKECIDAFAKNGFGSRSLTAHVLAEKDGTIQARYLEGEKLEQLIDAIDLDIR